MDWGLKNRLARIISPADNRALMLAVDHGYFLGPTEKLEDLKKTIAPLAKHCDSLMITRGALRTSVNPDYPVPIVLRVSGGTSIIGEDLSQEDITVSIKDALRLNVSAVAMSIFVGSKYEYQTIVNLGKLVNEAEEYGIPVLAVTAVGKEIGTKDARYLSLACRTAAEQGAHIVKTYYCENFEKVVDSCPVPIIIAGGGVFYSDATDELSDFAKKHNIPCFEVLGDLIASFSKLLKQEKKYYLFDNLLFKVFLIFWFYIVTVSFFSPEKLVSLKSSFFYSNYFIIVKNRQKISVIFSPPFFCVINDRLCDIPFL